MVVVLVKKGKKKERMSDAGWRWCWLRVACEQCFDWGFLNVVFVFVFVFILPPFPSMDYSPGFSPHKHTPILHPRSQPQHPWHFLFFSFLSFPLFPLLSPSSSPSSLSFLLPLSSTAGNTPRTIATALRPRSVCWSPRTRRCASKCASWWTASLKSIPLLFCVDNIFYVFLWFLALFKFFFSH